MEPRISSTFPIFVLFSRYRGALKYGIYRIRRPVTDLTISLVDLQRTSPSLSCITYPISVRKDHKSIAHRQHVLEDPRQSLFFHR